MKKIILGNIITMNDDMPAAEAVVVEDGIIQFVGTKEEAIEDNSDAEIVDYKDLYIYPGMLEAHAHPIYAGRRLILEVNVKSGQTMDEYVQMMKEYIDAHPDEEIYRGANFAIREKEPTAAMLDAVCSDKPVILNSVDGHSSWLNSKAMELCGYTKETIKEYGEGEIRRDSDGNPTGLFVDTPNFEILAKTAISVEAKKTALMAWQNFAFSQGVTGTTDASTTVNDAKAYQELVKEGKWKLRTFGHMVFLPASISKQYVGCPDEFVDLMLECKKDDSEYFKIKGIKMFKDGAFEARSALTKDEYPGRSDFYGVDAFPDKKLMQYLIEASWMKGLNTHIHTIGNRAVSEVLDIFEKASENVNPGNTRNTMAHLEYVDIQDIERICAKDYIVPAVAPLWAGQSEPIYSNQLFCMSKDKVNDMHPIASFVSRGQKVVFHTDYPVSDTISAPNSVYSAVKRHLKEEGNTPKANADKESISAYEALKALTINVARMWNEEDRLGSIETGKTANFTVYDKDFINNDIEDILDAEVKYTIVDGEVVYKG